MVGNLVLMQALNDESISSVIALVRKESIPAHPKLQEVVVSDFANLKEYEEYFDNVHASFFCIGVYTGAVPKDKFKLITYDYAVEFARASAQSSPTVKLCLLSGAGADRSEKSRVAFAKFKGMAENEMSRFAEEFYAFRPGYIYPVTPRNEPNFSYRMSRALYPVIKLFGKGMSIKSTELAEAIFRIGIEGGEQEVYENIDMMKFLDNS